MMRELLDRFWVLVAVGIIVLALAGLAVVASHVVPAGAALLQREAPAQPSPIVALRSLRADR